MKRLTSILAISVIAVMSAGAARADIASTTYVDNQVSPVATKADTNATNIETLQSGKQDKSAMVDSESDKLSEKNDTNYPTVAATYIIAGNALGTQVNSKLDKQFTGDANKNKAVITNDSGNVTTGTIATDMIADSAVTTAKIKDANVTTAKIADSAVTSAKIADGTIEEDDLSVDVKTKLNATVQTFNPASATAGKYVTNFTKSGTTVTATTAYVQIPVGSATAPTSVASIWVE